ncbi:MAG: hypothetical protein AAFQ42_12765 [Pseudomonadota bacterium]
MKTLAGFFLALLIVAVTSVVPARAEDVIDASSLKPLQSGWARGFEKNANVRLFVDPKFNCTDMSSTKKFYVVLQDEKYNAFPDRLASVIWRSTIAFNYEEGPLYCVFKTRDPSHRHKFHVVGLLDDEVVIDMKFIKWGDAFYPSRSYQESFFAKVRSAVRSLDDYETRTFANTSVKESATSFYMNKRIFTAYYQSNALVGESVTLCRLSPGSAAEKTLRAFGVREIRTVPIQSAQVLATRLKESDCDLAPVSVPLKEAIDKLFTPKKTAQETVDQARTRTFKISRRDVYGSMYDWYAPRLVSLKGDAQQRVYAAPAFRREHQQCEKQFSGTLADYYDCRCAVLKRLKGKQLRQCLSNYAYDEGLHEAFSSIASFEYGKFPNVSEPEKAAKMLRAADCAAKQYAALFRKAVPTTARHRSAIYRRLIGPIQRSCVKRVQ